MKSRLLFWVAIFSASIARGQAPQVTPSQATPDEFRLQVLQELARVPAGAELYRRCDIFARKVNSEAALALRIHSKATPGILNIEQDTTLEADISRSVSDEDEPSIAINRRNPRIILAGANDMMFDGTTLGGMTTLSMPAYLSTDAGLSWNTYRLPQIDDNGATAWGDPMIISDNGGTFYYAFLLDAFSPNNISDLMVARSTDGQNWTLGSPVVGNTGDLQVLEDKETIAIDRDLRSPHFGRLYIAWTEYQYVDSINSYSEMHFLAFSDDQGDSWSSPVQYTQQYGYFALLRVGELGTVFIASMSPDGTDSTGGNSGGIHGMTISTDGGESFTDLPIATFTDFPLNVDGRTSLKGENGFRAIPYLSFDLDSGNKILAAYGSYDQNNGDAALYEVQSSDLGQTWSNSMQIGSPWGLGNDHYMPWVNVDPITRRTYISMSSSEEDTILNVKSRAVFCNYRTPNQLQEMGSRLFNTLAVTASGGDFLGDYAGSDAYGGYYASSWTENRPPNNHDGEIFAYVSSPISPNDPSNGVTRQINGRQFDATVSPNPASGDAISISISSNEEGSASVRLFDLKGNEVLLSSTAIIPSGANSVSLDIHSLPAGIYHIQISSGAEQLDRNLVILR